MSTYESIFFWISIVLFAVSSGGYIYGCVFKNPRVFNRLQYVVCAGFITLNATIAFRYQATGHLPWSGDYENGLSGSWFILLFAILLSRKLKGLDVIFAAVLPCVLLIMGFGVTRTPSLAPMAASLKSVWLYVHVYFAMISFGAYTLAMGTGVMYLLKNSNESRAEDGSFYANLPSLERLDELMFRYVVFGFITDAIMLVSGAFWAKNLWGNYWSWDPVETWSLISWLLYGISLHLRLTLGWRGYKLAWLVILALSTVIISYFGVTFMVNTSMHVFNVRQP